jgi:prolipoprotein diacylglyceryltransferase
MPGFVLGWASGAIAGIIAIVVACARLRLSFRATTLVCITLVMAVLVGTKLLYLAEMHAWLAVHPNDLWGFLASSRMRIPGGIVLAAAACWPLGSVLGVRSEQLADEVFPMAASLCLIAVRLGCFLEGCCHGYVSSVPWAITFPPGAAAYTWQLGSDLIPADAPNSLPVHPLQAYYALSGIALCAWGCWCRHFRQYHPGMPLLSWLALYLASAWVLDHFSAVPSPVTRTFAVVAFSLVILRIASRFVECRVRSRAASKAQWMDIA